MIDAVAAIFSLVGAALVSSKQKERRLAGFGIWVVSNCMWALFGYSIGNFWLVLQNAVFLLSSFNGIKNNH